MIKDITITFTLDTDNNTLRVQATNSDMNKIELMAALEEFRYQVRKGDFHVSESGGSYAEETYKLD